MGVAKVTCPSCSSQLKLSDATKPGQKVRCPKCEYAFPAPPTEGSDAGPATPPAEPPEPPKKRRFRDDDLAEAEDREAKEDAEAQAGGARLTAAVKSRKRDGMASVPSPARIWVEKNRVLAGAIAAGVLLVVGVGAFLLLNSGDAKPKDLVPPPDSTAKKPPPAPKVSLFNYDLIKVGAKLSEVERFMGRGSPVKDTSALPKLDAKTEDLFQKTYRASNPSKVVAWEEDEDWLVVGLTGSKGAEVIVFKALFRKEGDRFTALLSAEPPKKEKK